MILELCALLPLFPLCYVILRHLGNKWKREIMFCADGQEAPTADDGRHCFGKREDIIQAKRVVKLVNGRDVLVLYHEGEFYALDVRCYRKDDHY